MLDTTTPSSATAETAQVFLLGVLEFYDKNPIVASIGFLAVTTVWPLKIVLNHFYKIKQEDNKLVMAKMQAQLKKAQLEMNSLRGER